MKKRRTCKDDERLQRILRFEGDADDFKSYLDSKIKETQKENKNINDKNMVHIKRVNETSVYDEHSFTVQEYNDGECAQCSVGVNNDFEHLAVVTEEVSQHIQVLGYDTTDNLKSLYKVSPSVRATLDELQAGEHRSLYNGSIHVVKIK